MTLETVTPLFLGGADPRGAPELRAPSFRGALRYWLRAALGGVLGDQNLDALRKAEVAVFGDTTTASSINCLVKPKQMSKPRQLGLKPKDNLGQFYLFWTFEQLGRKRLDSVGFDLELRTRSGSPKGEDLFRRASAALWLLVQLGGLGARARRGAGSLRVLDVKGEWPTDLPLLKLDARTPQELTRCLSQGIRQVRSAFGGHLQTKVQVASSFDVLHPAVCEIYVWNRTRTSAEDVLESLGAALRSARGGSQPDHDTVLKVLRGQEAKDPIKRAAFGLPMQFYYRSLHKDLGGQKETRFKATADIEPAASGIDRRASPLLFHIHQLLEDRFTAVLTFFRARLLPANIKLRIKPRDRNVRPTLVNQPDYGAIEDFLATQPLLEVNYR